MKPAVADLLMNAAATLGTGVAPHLADKPYALGHVGAIGLILVFLAQEAERAVDTLVTDNEEMRALFRQARAAPLSTGLLAALARAGEGKSQSLHLRVLEADNAALKALLVALHEEADNSPTQEARTLQSAIWKHLKASADRRALVLPPS